MNKEITYKITEHIGVLSQKSNGYQKELNLVSWNGAAPKYDIREWFDDHEKMTKGTTLTKEEATVLRDLLNKQEL